MVGEALALRVPLVALLVVAMHAAGGAARHARAVGDRQGRAGLELNAAARVVGDVAVKARRAAAVDEAALKEFLAGEYERTASASCRAETEARWNHRVGLTNATTSDEDKNATLAFATVQQELKARLKDINVETIKDADLKRQLQFLVDRKGTSAMSSADFKELHWHMDMEATYNTAKVCPFSNPACDPSSEGLDYDPDIEQLMMTSRNYDELTYIWKAWHDATGRKMRGEYREYVEQSNKDAKESGYNDNGEEWQASYEVDDFKNTIDKLWNEVRPLYEDLHTYTLNRLRERKVYGNRIDKDTNLIPGHLLGNMWGLTWVSLYDILVPYPNASSYNLTQALNDQKYTPKKMFETADEFYQSMGLLSSEMAYGPKAMIEKPTDGRVVTCHGAALEFCDGKDFRITMCARVHQSDFQTIHHEMGHVQYFQQYKNQPFLLRRGANPGFHEAVGDTIALSAATPKHLEKINLLKGYEDTKESRVNALMKMALVKVAFLPFGLLVDKWRWDVFSGLTPESEWNKHWWELKEKYQLMSAPVKRSEDDFDPGAKYHVPAGSKYISYFFAHMLQFQFYKALCIEAGEYKPDDPNSEPLHSCDFFNSKAAGEKLGAGLRLGASKHWSETLKVITGETEMTGKALLEYFQPLHEFLQEANKGKSPSSPSSSSNLVPSNLLVALLFLCLYRC